MCPDPTVLQSHSAGSSVGFMIGNNGQLIEVSALSTRDLSAFAVPPRAPALSFHLVGLGFEANALTVFPSWVRPFDGQGADRPDHSVARVRADICLIFGRISVRDGGIEPSFPQREGSAETEPGASQVLYCEKTEDRPRGEQVILAHAPRSTGVRRLQRRTCLPSEYGR